MSITIQEQKFATNQLSEKRLLSNYPQDLIIVSEGDSWFNYPLKKDVIDHLVKKGYAVKNFAKHGDTLENMIYGTSYKVNDNNIEHQGPISLQMTLTAMRQLKPKFFLFSAGGNDVVGQNLIQYLNHKNVKSESLLNHKIFNAKLDYMKKSIEFLIKSVANTNPDCHILMDGYDYAKVTGKGYNFVGIKLSGPWILPAMGAKAITESDKQNEVIKMLIDKFNDMLSGLDKTYSNFHHIDLRGQFPHVNSWDNEIHLKSKGYEEVAKRYDEKMCKILKYNITKKLQNMIIA